MRLPVLAGGLASVLAVIFLLAPCSEAAENASTILKCVAGNMPRPSSVQNVEFRSEDLFEDVRVLRASVYLSYITDTQLRVLAYFHDPFEVRGARILLIEKESGNETFLYAPALGDVRRLTARHVSSSVNGTDFSYEDLEQLYGMAKGGLVTRLADAQLNGAEVYVLRSTASVESASTYQRVDMYIDKQNCVTMKMELYEKGGKLRKIYTVVPESVRQLGDLWIPFEMAMQDIRRKTETKLIVHKLEVDESLPDEMFDKEHLSEFKAR